MCRLTVSLKMEFAMPLYSDRTMLIDTENAFKIGPYIKEVEQQGHKVIKCNLGEPDFALPEHIRTEIKRQIDLDNVHYNDPQGILSLRKAVAKQLSETRGLKITPERVVVFPGAKPPIGLCQQTYTNPGDEVIYPSPGFPIYESFIGYVSAVPKPLILDEENGFSFSSEDLAKLITPRTKLIFLNFPSNPTGGVATKEQMREVAEVIGKKAPKDIRVYSDEVYENIVFDGWEHHSVASCPGMADKTIIVSGVSKSYSWTGGRIGWAAFPTEEEALIFKNLNINYFSCVPAYNQEGAREALESPKKRGVDPSHGLGVSSAARRRGEGAQRDKRCHLPKSERRFLRISKRGRTLREAGRHRRVQVAARKHARAHKPIHAFADVFALPLSRRNDGQKIVRPDRQRESSLPAHLDCNGN